MFNYTKKLLFSFLLVLVLPYMNSISKAMDGGLYELEDIGNKKVQMEDLRRIPAEDFQRPHIRLMNISSNQKFFDDHYDSKAGCYHSQKSISQKLLKAIAGGYVTKLEYSFSPQMTADKDKIETFMYRIAMGQKIAKVKKNDGTIFLKMDYGCGYTDFIKISNRIVVMCGNEPHFITREWQEEEEVNNRLAQLAIAHAQDERRRNREERLETMGAGADGFARGYDPYSD